MHEVCGDAARDRIVSLPGGTGDWGGGGVKTIIDTGQVGERLSARNMFLSQLRSVACDVTHLWRGYRWARGRPVGLLVPLRLTLQLKDISWETRVRNVF